MYAPAAASTAMPKKGLKKDPKKNRCKCLIARLLCRNDPNSVAKTYGALAFSGSALARYSID
jgi:hypothetical protein